MQILNFLNDKETTINLLKNHLDNFLNKETLIINDTRWMIIPSVLPFIEFVCTYDQRILPMISDTNIILTPPFNDNYLKYLNDFWLAKNIDITFVNNKKEMTLAKVILEKDDLIEKIKLKNYKKIVPFFVNQDMEDLSKKLQIPLWVSKDIFEKSNDKLLLKKFLISQKLPTIFWDFSSDINILKKYFENEKRYLFKDPLWVSWYGFWDNKENNFKDLEENYQNKELIIEEFIDKNSSPSVQFFISEDKKDWIIFWLTDQLLENWKVYLWNTSPSIYLKTIIWEEIFSQSKSIIEYIANLWYVWFWWIDFIVDKEDRVFATEVNARFTWATYPAITSILLNLDFESKWEFYNYGWENEDIIDFLDKKCIKNKNETWIFPLWVSWLKEFWKANLLKFYK